MEIKISPLLLFLGLFILLALSVYFGKYGQLLVGPDYDSSNIESYMTLEYRTAPLQKVVLQSYSPTSSQVYKLFDNIFFDRTNANTIELIGYQKEMMGNTDVLVYRIYTPDGFTNQYKNVTRGQVVSESTISAIPSTYSSFMVDSVLVVSNTAALFPSKQVSVVTWNKDTFITMINLGNVGSASSVPIPAMGFMAYFPNSASASIQQRYYDITNINFNSPTSQYPIGLKDAGSNSVSDLYDGKSLALTNYDSTKMVYQVCMNVLYDTKNSSIIVKNADGTIVVYTRPTSLGVNPSGTTYPDTSSQPAKNTTTTVSSVSYAPWFFITPDNKYLVQYIAWGQNTIVTIFVNRNGLLVVYKCYRFNSDGTIDGDKSVVQPAGSAKPSSSGSSSSDSSSSGNTAATGTNALSDYYQWLAFWNTVAKSPSTANLSASNLVPKSSIVPPVCPSCPSCSGNTACTNCGGQGGSGTQGASGSGSGSDSGIGSGSLLRDAGSGTTSLLRDTGSGTVNLIKDTGSGTAQFAKDTASGTAQFAKDAASGTVGLAKETVGGAVGLVKDTAGGVANMFGVKNPTQVQSGTSGSGPGANTSTAYQQTIPGSDPYSYFGAIPPKGANYIPVTASFSAFSK